MSPAAHSTLDDVAEIIRGIGLVLMSMDAKLEQIVELLRGGEDEAETDL